MLVYVIFSLYHDSVYFHGVCKTYDEAVEALNRYAEKGVYGYQIMPAKIGDFDKEGILI